MTGRHLTTVRCSQVIGPVFIVQAPLVKHCHLSSLHATCHSDLAVVIIPCNREHVAWHHLALQPVMMRNWGWVESFENSQSSVSVVWPPAVLLIILSLTKWRHINFYPISKVNQLQLLVDCGQRLCFNFQNVVVIRGEDDCVSCDTNVKTMTDLWYYTCRSRIRISFPESNILFQLRSREFSGGYFNLTSPSQHSSFLFWET